ncbi:MAG: Copper chaperone CopZ [Pseudomonadota bacterium]|jgi:copper chaperone
MDNSFQVQGMTCGHCEMAVKKAIARLDPNAKVEIDRSTGKVEVQSKLPREDIAHAIADEGYAVA